MNFYGKVNAAAAASHGLLGVRWFVCFDLHTGIIDELEPRARKSAAVAAGAEAAAVKAAAAEVHITQAEVGRKSLFSGAEINSSSPSSSSNVRIKRT